MEVLHGILNSKQEFESWINWQDVSGRSTGTSKGMKRENDFGFFPFTSCMKKNKGYKWQEAKDVVR